MARFSVLAPAALFLLTACAAQGGPSGRMGSGGAGDFNTAVHLVDQGEYERALPILRCVAGQGTGFEIAQYFAGYSALRLSSDEATPAIMRDELRVEGFDRLTSAAQAGWPTAQAELATQFATMNTEDAPVQAAYWAEVYRHNTRDQTYGLDRLDNGIEAQIAERVDAAQTAQIERLAAGFVAQPLASIPVTPACAPHLGSRGFGPTPSARRPDSAGRGSGGPGHGGTGSGRGGGRPGG